MTLSLRVDVDVPFGYHTRVRRLLNRLKIDYGLIPGWESLGYLGPAIELLEHLHDRHVPATWFFGTFSAPNQQRAKQILSQGHNIAFHSERTASYEDFSFELKRFEEQIAMKVRGFSKHGSGEMKLSRRHHTEYDTDQLVQYAGRARLDYFIGNGMNYQESWEKIGGVVFVPSVFWLDRMNQYQNENILQDVIRFSEFNPVVVLMHPVWWKLRNELRKHLTYLLDNTDPQLLERAIDTLCRYSQT